MHGVNVTDMGNIDKEQWHVTLVWSVEGIAVTVPWNFKLDSLIKISSPTYITLSLLRGSYLSLIG